MNRLTMTANTALRRLDQMFPGYFGGAKHNHYKDFGFPENPGFSDFYAAYERNGLATAGVDKTIAKTWQDFPFVLEKPRDAGQSTKETRWEKQIRERFEKLRVWQRLAEADRRGMVGDYAGVILRLADNKTFREPVDTVPGGLDGLVEVIPAWEGQLTPSQWDTDEKSETYGEPTMYQFNEASVGKVTQPRAFMVHPHRVLIWSRDGTIHGRSALKAGLNYLLTADKIIGAGGEGFWKNAKSALVLEVDKDASVDKMAKGMGVPSDQIADKMDEQVQDWNQGFDASLLLQGIAAKTVPVTLPSPEHFFSIAVQSFAASIMCPMKILVGMQTGERASTEDAEEWAQTNMSRRASFVIPNIMAFILRLVQFGMIPERGWSLSWAPLTEAKPGEKTDRSKKMVETNKASVEATGERVFTITEVRAAAGDYEPLSPEDAKVEKPAAADPKKPEDDQTQPDKTGQE